MSVQQVTYGTYHYRLMLERTHPLSGSEAPPEEIKQLLALVCSILIGLAILYWCLWMGGVFADLGPWFIFGVTLLAKKFRSASSFIICLLPLSVRPTSSCP